MGWVEGVGVGACWKGAGVSWKGAGVSPVAVLDLQYCVLILIFGQILDLVCFLVCSSHSL